jgi:uncharacterized protein
VFVPGTIDETYLHAEYGPHGAFRLSHTTVIICPGNGCTNIRQSNWYGDLYDQLRQKGIPVVCEDFPDPFMARRSVWIAHIRTLAQGSPNVVLVGHSSGAQAVLRYAELYPIHAGVLVAATYSDLGDPGEKASGYYPRMEASSDGGMSTLNPYDFEAMRRNCQRWFQFHSDDDPFIPLREAEQIRDGLGLDGGEHVWLAERSHFFEPFPELAEVVQKMTNC